MAVSSGGAKKWLLRLGWPLVGLSLGCGTPHGGPGVKTPHQPMRGTEAAQANTEDSPTSPEGASKDLAQRLDQLCGDWKQKGVLDVATLYCEASFEHAPTEARFRELTALYRTTSSWLAHADLLKHLVSAPLTRRSLHRLG